jgi:hypothetical protein
MMAPANHSPRKKQILALATTRPAGLVRLALSQPWSATWLSPFPTLSTAMSAPAFVFDGN